MGARPARRFWTDSAGASWIASALRSLLRLSARTVSRPGFGQVRERSGQTWRVPTKRPNR
eukprot:12469459-Alexandrium_andersonii.AAC.1